MLSLKLLVTFVLATSLPSSTHEPTLSLPPGPTSDFMQSPSGPAAQLPPAHDVPDWSTPAWREADPWTAWAKALASPDEPEARLELMRMAHALKRSEAAWGHFVQLPRAWAEDLLSELLAAPRSDAEGVLLLQPLLPPMPVFDSTSWSGAPPKRSLVANGLEFEGTRFSLSVEVAPEGVEVRVAWEAGPARKARLVIPTPDDWKTRLVYVDWERTDLSHEGYDIRLGPPLAGEEPELVLWARCESERRTWPRLSGSYFPAQGTRLEFHTTKNDPELARLTEAAAFLTSLLDLKVTVISNQPSSMPLPVTHSPLVIDLSPGSSRDLKLRDLLAQAEKIALARRVVEIPMPR